MALVDHSEYSQSADNIENANIICVVDHHGVGSVTVSKALIYDARPVGSTATIIHSLYREYGEELDRNTAFLLMGAVLSDTNNLYSETTTAADREALKALAERAGVDDTDAVYREMYKELISFEGMTDEEFDAALMEYSKTHNLE